MAYTWLYETFSGLDQKEFLSGSFLTDLILVLMFLNLSSYQLVKLIKILHFGHHTV